jgi:hypothetical protein
MSGLVTGDVRNRVMELEGVYRRLLQCMDSVGLSSGSVVPGVGSVPPPRHIHVDAAQRGEPEAFIPPLRAVISCVAALFSASGLSDPDLFSRSPARFIAAALKAVRGALGVPGGGGLGGGLTAEQWAATGYAERKAIACVDMCREALASLERTARAKSGRRSEAAFRRLTERVKSASGASGASGRDHAPARSARPPRSASAGAARPARPQGSKGRGGKGASAASASASASASGSSSASRSSSPPPSPLNRYPQRHLVVPQALSGAVFEYASASDAEEDDQQGDHYDGMDDDALFRHESQMARRGDEAVSFTEFHNLAAVLTGFMASVDARLGGIARSMDEVKARVGILETKVARLSETPPSSNYAAPTSHQAPPVVAVAPTTTAVASPTRPAFRSDEVAPPTFVSVDGSAASSLPTSGSRTPIGHISEAGTADLLIRKINERFRQTQELLKGASGTFQK